jgi:hypothetical protein
MRATLVGDTLASGLAPSQASMTERKEDNPDVKETGPMEYKVQSVTVIFTALSTL